MSVSIANLNSFCGVECATSLKDYANVFEKEYKSSIHDYSYDEFLSKFKTKLDSKKLCFRGAGHSMHGRSLPSSGEILVSTCNMNRVKILDHITLEVDCGVQIGSLNAFLNQYNCRLPIIHSGGSGGPSAAGFFLAGGFGIDSSIFGGFWSNVEEILWSDCLSVESNWYDQTDSKFWEISGSGGRISGFLEKLRLRFFVNDDSTKYCLPSNFVIYPQPHPFEIPTIWWTIFCPTSYERELRRIIRSFLPFLTEFVLLLAPRKILINQVNSYPNFLSCFDEPLYAISIGGQLLGDRSNSAYQVSLIIEDLCDKCHPFLVSYSSSEFSSSSFLQS